MNIRKLTPCEFARAIKLGHGRAFLHIVQYGDAGMEEEIQRALLQSYVYDWQIEGTRAYWIFNLAEATGHLRQYAEHILEHWKEETFTYNDLAQQIRIAWQFFESGFPALRKGAFEKYQRLIETTEFRSDSGIALIDVAGLFGLEFVARTIGRTNLKIDDCDYAFILNHAKETLDESDCVKHLTTLADVDEGIGRFLQACARYEIERPTPLQAKAASLTLEEILDRIDRREHAPSGYMYSRYGRNITEEEAQKIFTLLEETNDPWKQSAYLRIFHHRSLPALTTKILQCLESPDRWTVLAAAKVLSQIESPIVRQTALRMMRSGAEDEIASGFDLLEKNYQPGDEEVIRNALRLLNSDQRKHDAGISIQAIAKAHKNDELVEFLFWTYENGPESWCRRSVLKELLERKKCPAEMLYEAQWDCADDTQYMARAILAELEVITGNA